MKIALVALAVAACSAPVTRRHEPPPAPVPLAHEVLPDVPFAKLDAAQRAEFMKQKVVPAMKPIFVRHDPVKYAKFGCMTCHVTWDHFEMPNPRLSPPVPSPWMEQEVQPAMQELLSAPSGFGCTTCHVVP